jgi:hypothetical protein
VIDTRNYLTHYDENLKAQSLGHEEMIEATQRLRILLTIILLKHLNLDEGTIEQVVSNNKNLTKWIR